MQDNEIYTTGIEPGQQPENGGKKHRTKAESFSGADCLQV